MAPDRDPPTDAEPALVTAAIEPGELYVVVRKAVEDAILGVVGTLLLVGLALVLVWFGVLVAVSSYDSNLLAALSGIFVVLFGLYVAASALEVVPSAWDVL